MNNEWMRLDNAAKIYPLIESDFITTVFRFSATLKHEIKRDVLLEALNKIMPRFPYYKVTLKSGFFWYYLEHNKQPLEVYEDIASPCRRMNRFETNGYLFRVLYRANTIAVEFNHILGDGTACLTFLNTLIHQYLTLEGYEVSLHSWMKDINTPAPEGEYEDSHSLTGKKYYKTHNKKQRLLKDVFHLKDRLMRRSKFHVTYGIVDSEQLSALAKSFDTSITILLTSIYIESLLDIQKEQVRKPRKRKPVAIQIPVNMRKRLESTSMRNFSLFIIPYFYPKENYTLTEIIAQVSTYFKENITLDNLISLIVQNYKTERTPFVRYLPLALKKVVTPFIYKSAGVDTYSGTLSNIGMIQLPEDTASHIERYSFLLGPCPLNKCSCSVIGYIDKVCISFGRNTKAARLERKFLNKLVKLGLHVKVETHGGDIK